MNTLGLIGKKLGHSASPRIFKEIFDANGLKEWTYELFEIKKIEEIAALIIEKEIGGFNVTVPYKEEIIPLLSAISDEAKAIGAVNTVKIDQGDEEITLHGYNTDVFGFEKMLFVNDIRPNNCLILGTGGASKAVQYVLINQGVHFELVSRTKTEDTMLYSDLQEDIFKEFDTIINTTPLGMYPNVETLPDLPYHAFTKYQTAIDLVYNPEKTLFLGLAEANRCRILNGQQMLQFQAEKAWEIFKES